MRAQVSQNQRFAELNYKKPGTQSKIRRPVAFIFKYDLSPLNCEQAYMQHTSPKINQLHSVQLKKHIWRLLCYCVQLSGDNASRSRRTFESVLVDKKKLAKARELPSSAI
jgi:hypothetical protein